MKTTVAIIGVVTGILTILGAGYYAWAWGVNYVVDDRISALNAVVVENRTLIAGNSDRLALITYDRLLRKLRVEGRLSPRDLRAFCLAAARLQIRHPACR